MDKYLNPTLIYSIILGFIVVTILCPIILPLLKYLKFGQFEREEGLESHKKKSGTPTMGGVIFILGALISMIILGRNPSDESMISLYAFIAFGLIGFFDDFLKIKYKNNLGLRAYQKMILLLVIGGVFSYYAYKNVGSEIIIPFTGKVANLGMLYIPFTIVVFAATTNAVNLTDGLDGLATSVTALVMTFFAIVSLAMGHWTLALFCGVIIGSLLGFLRVNVYPAKVFMGDTGSLALGGAVAAVAIMLKSPIILFIVGGIYVMEALSVIIQVTSFKLTGKRVFKMSPIHHHFELKGWHETRVVAIFSITTVLLCLLGFLSFSII
jgi:phospho-N-acetylmuramoyl-pentapeptide-transferase